MLTLLVLLVCCDAPTWGAERLLRIGSIDGRNTAFSWIGGVAVGSDHELFVAQPQEHEIRVFDRHGTFLRRIGRSGGAPGEFRSISDVTFVHGHLRARDEAAGRLTEFDVEGRVRETYSLPPVRLEDPFFVTAPLAVDRDGNRYVVPSYRVGGRTVDEVPLFMVDAEGNVRRLATLRAGDRLVTVRTQRWVIPVAVPVNGATFHALDYTNQNVVLVDRPLATSAAEHEFRIIRISPAGDTVVARSYRYAPVRIPRAVVERERSRRTDEFVAHTERSGAPISRQEVAAIWREGFRVPQFQAPVDEIVVAASGEIWLRRGAFGEARSEWIVFDRRGDPIGKLFLPAESRIAHASADRIVVIERDELDISYVAVYRLLRK